MSPGREFSPSIARPGAVPLAAEWFFESQEWLLCQRDAQGELHGSLRTFRGDGTPWLEFEYRHGKRHGQFRRFYPSGQVAQAGRYFEDLLDGLLTVYSDGDQPYAIRECCIPAQARVMKQEHRQGQLLAEAFYDAAGQLLDEDVGAPGARGWPQPLREREGDVLFGEYGFWPAREVFPAAPAGETAHTEQPLPAMKDAIQRAAQRLQALCAARPHDATGVAPPDLSALLPEPALALRCFSFSTEGDPPSTVQVDERLSPVGLSARELAERARLEWTGLCWLCWAAGLDAVALPLQLAPQPDFYAALLAVSARQAALTGHELRPDAASHFHGLDETKLPASALAQLADHYREIRAMLLFASDPECQSPWQDDLGREPEPVQGEPEPAQGKPEPAPGEA